jgi:hypothetical protein
MKQTLIYALLATLVLGWMCNAGIALGIYSPRFAWGLFGVAWLLGAVVMRLIYKNTQ